MENDLILERYEKYYSLLKRVFDPDTIDEMFETLGDRIALCPLSHTESEGGAPGKMIEFSLRVAQKAKVLAEEHDLVKSAIRVSLVHELGKVGDIDNSMYVEQDSDWHIEKLGQTYKFNESCKRMNIGHRTLFILQHFKINLTKDEWTAVLLSQGMHHEESRYYGADNNVLSSIIQYARSCAA